MSDSKKYRERTIEYRQAEHMLEETHRTFKAENGAARERHPVFSVMKRLQGGTNAPQNLITLLFEAASHA